VFECFVLEDTYTQKDLKILMRILGIGEGVCISLVMQILYHLLVFPFMLYILLCLFDTFLVGSVNQSPFVIS
jgi:hypothetical protein